MSPAASLDPAAGGATRPPAALPRIVLTAAALLFVSGFCALVYQVTWLRMLRLVFGASTASTAAVLAIFMGGLGVGSWVLGRRADRSANPLDFYARLEFGIGVSAGISPLLLLAVRSVYLSLGGSVALGTALGTGLRLLLSTLVLGLPAFLMGGTLPALARAVEREADRSRRRVGLLYAVNTLGAVSGALVTTFFALEFLGMRKSVWVAALLNLLVAVAARALARRLGAGQGAAEPAGGPEPRGGAEAPAAEAPVDRWTAGFVPLAAGLVGFAFFLMELVWYRMLAPILGGTSYTFGLILAVALLGIGAGGLVYAAGRQGRVPTLVAFGATCAAESLLLIAPYALGDRLAVLAIYLRPLGAAGFGPLVGAWTALTAIVVLPTAVVAGYQFPLLIGILGRGQQRVGRQVGLVYACNTAGAIAGAIAGGFGLMPLISAPGLWRLAALLLVALAVAAVLVGLRSERRRLRVGWSMAVGAAAALLCTVQGPTEAWRHSPIGAGRVAPSFDGPNDLRSWLESRRRLTTWQVDGVESSVALMDLDAYSFIINGKSDGNAMGDAATMVMSSLLGAALHPDPRRALIVGLGTGMSAGWLAEVPSIEAVEVVEIEPAIRRVAAACAAVNQGVLEQPKVSLVFADAREVLQATSGRFDLILSEPSNPYRAGIASLFSREFYGAVAERLADGGLFLQWMQGYEIDPQLVRTVYATLGSVFPVVESWQVSRADLLLVASTRPLDHDVDRIRARVAGEPFRSALAWTWGVEGVEGLYAGYLAGPAFAAAVAAREGAWINTDDRPILEFGFARNLGRVGLFSIDELRALAERLGDAAPPSAAALEAPLIEELRQARRLAFQQAPAALAGDGDLERRLAARHAYLAEQPRQALADWLGQEAEPPSPIDRTMLGELLAVAGDERARLYAARLQPLQPATADAISARLYEARGELELAARTLGRAFVTLRHHPWVYRPLLQRALEQAQRLARRNPALGEELFAALGEPFAVRYAEEQRLRTRLRVAALTDFPRLCREALAPFEPHPPWEETLLRQRTWCYEVQDLPEQERARAALDAFFATAPLPLAHGLEPPDPAAAAEGAEGGPAPRAETASPELGGAPAPPG